MPFERQKLTEKSSKTKKIFGLFLGIFLIFLGFFMKYKDFVKNFEIKETREVIITKEDSLSNLGKKISEFDTIFYKIYLKLDKPDFKLKEGRFALVSGQNLEQTWKSLETPIFDTIKVTLLEGRNIYDVDDYLAEKNLISTGEYISYVTNKEKIVALSEFFPFLKFDLESLEGYLYPDTYLVDPANFKINNFVITQLEEFETRVYNKLFAGKYDNETIYDVVNLASIVQKEESIDENKATVAGILKKRLNAGWQIGADATVCYAHKIPTSKCTPSKVLEYLYDKNDYNTRQKTGLPKTPICNPEYSTIEATLNDKKTTYWYYLHNLSGQIYYAVDEAGHNYNKANYMNSK